MATSGSENNPVGDRVVDRSDSVLLAFHRDALLFSVLLQGSKLLPLFLNNCRTFRSTLQWLVNFLSS